LHAIDRSTPFDTTVAISVVRHLHYVFAQHRHQLSTLNWLIILYLQRITSKSPGRSSH
jgi:hypothetical protein